MLVYMRFAEGWHMNFAALLNLYFYTYKTPGRTFAHFTVSFGSTMLTIAQLGNCNVRS